MRHADKLKAKGYPTLSIFGMPRSPHKRSRAVWVIVDAPVHAGGNNVSGNSTKAKRNKTGPPGTPNGVCNEANNKGHCMCGKNHGMKIDTTRVINMGDRYAN